MKHILAIFLLFTWGISRSQTRGPLKIVWDMSARDTSEHSAIFRQVNNVLMAEPTAQIEVVFHGNAIWVLTSDSSLHAPRIQKDIQRGVIIAACNNSLRRLKVDPSRLLPGITVVPVAMIELARKQQEGWSYIKAGQ